MKLLTILLVIISCSAFAQDKIKYNSDNKTYQWERISGPSMIDTVTAAIHPNATVYRFTVDSAGKRIYSDFLTFYVSGRDTVQVVKRDTVKTPARVDTFLVTKVVIKTDTVIKTNVVIKHDTIVKTNVVVKRDTITKTVVVRDTINIAGDIKIVHDTIITSLVLRDTIYADNDPLAKECNYIPIVDAGQDTTIVIPPNTITKTFTLRGKAIDKDGKIKTVAWRKAKGPRPGTPNYPSRSITTTTGFSKGTYWWEMSAKDDKGAIAKDTIYVNVIQPIK